MLSSPQLAQSIPVIDTLPYDGLNLTMLADSKIKRIKAGETLYIEGDRAPQCFQLVSGVIKEYNMLEDGRRQILDFYSTGDIFGLSETDHHLYTAEAITDCVIRCYSRETYINAITASSSLARQFFGTMMSRLHRTHEKIIMLGRMSALGRIASFLLRLSSEQRSSSNIRFLMSRQDIGDHLGLTIETVCRTLTDLKQRGVITSTAARTFSIADKQALQQIAYGET